MLLDPLKEGHSTARLVAASGQIIGPDLVADAVIDGIGAEKFLILPHPEVAAFFAQRAADPDRWLAGVRRLAQQVDQSPATSD